MGGRAPGRKERHQEDRPDPGGSVIRRVVRLGEARWSSSQRLSRCRPRGVPGSRQRKGRRDRSDVGDRSDEPAACRRRQRPSDLLRLVRAGEHRPQPGHPQSPRFCHGRREGPRRWSRRRHRALGRPGGGRGRLGSRILRAVLAPGLAGRVDPVGHGLKEPRQQSRARMRVVDEPTCLSHQSLLFRKVTREVFG
jgi:hypothetical protein